MPSADASLRYFRFTLVLVGALLAFRLLYAAWFATSPAGDEAYYWDWGRRLDYGYFSKPPGIAWLYAFVDRILGGGLFPIRATAAVLGTGSLLLLYRLVADLYDARTAWIAVLLGAAAPANAVLSFFLTIDAPLVVCWTTALWALWRWAAGRGGQGLLAVLFFALSLGHLFKQMMMVFPLLALIFLATSSETRALLRRPALWITLLGSYLSLIPPLLWNARNGWITFKHTGHHFEGGSAGGNALLERLEDFISFLGTQLGVLSPGTAFIVFSLCLGGLPLLLRAQRNHRFLLVFGALPLAVMLLLALRQGLQPNWAAVYYLSGITLAAAWYSGRIDAPFPPSSWRRLLPATLSLGIALCAFFYAAPPVFEAFGKPGHPLDPNRRLQGYVRLAAEFEAVRRSRPDAEALCLIALGHRDLTSQLAFALPDRPRLYRWEASGKIQSQYEIWNDPVADGWSGRDGLILVPGGRMSDKFGRAFETTEEIARFRIPLGGQEMEFSVELGRKLRTWPIP